MERVSVDEVLKRVAHAMESYVTSPPSPAPDPESARHPHFDR